MWSVDGNNITMTEGEFGVGLPMTISGVQFSANDELRLTIKRNRSGVVVYEKSYSDISGNTITVQLTQSDTENLPAGVYVYSLAWYQDGFFLAYLINKATFEVVKPA